MIIRHLCKSMVFVNVVAVSAKSEREAENENPPKRQNRFTTVQTL
ncbi:MAG TPA: hypothetical protein VLX11_09685 [Candidatus Acidoferrales bacterium]|nr:hypothetical protein [Candidatus Acidoferrales bacterium]